MEEIEFITLEDGIEYVIMDEIDNSGTVYVYLTNADDEKDFCIRKLDKSGEKEMLVGLDSDSEFDKALLLYTKKHGNDDLVALID